ncbi:hypothetical protein ZK67_005177 [Salmonella enterica subsp. enterica serovar Oranienburg]|nr:hypothetical protein [Salmonella enterica subsp. enterica serovar Oranienburg]
MTCYVKMLNIWLYCARWLWKSLIPAYRYSGMNVFKSWLNKRVVPCLVLWLE